MTNNQYAKLLSNPYSMACVQRVIDEMEFEKIFTTDAFFHPNQSRKDRRLCFEFMKNAWIADLHIKRIGENGIFVCRTNTVIEVDRIPKQINKHL